MGIDIRLPIGAMFAIIGVMLVIFGAATAGNENLYRVSREIYVNSNFWWGLALCLVGALMLYFGWRKESAARHAAK
jgi:hypothetical protein